MKIVVLNVSGGEMFSTVKSIVQQLIANLSPDEFESRGNTPYFLVTMVTEDKGFVTEESFGGFIRKLTTSENIDFIAAKAHTLTGTTLDLYARQRVLIVDDDILGQSRIIYLNPKHVIVITVIANSYNSKHLSSKIRTKLIEDPRLT